MGCSPGTEVNVVLTDDDEIHELNRTWRGIDRATDVLSFAYAEAENAALEPDLLGDLVISVETAARQAAEHTHGHRMLAAGYDAGEWTLLHELVFLLIHGGLHLVGFDHDTSEKEAVMRAREAEILASVLSDVCLPS